MDESGSPENPTCRGDVCENAGTGLSQVWEALKPCLASNSGYLESSVLERSLAFTFADKTTLGKTDLYAYEGAKDGLSVRLEIEHDDGRHLNWETYQYLNSNRQIARSIFKVATRSYVGPLTLKKAETDLADMGFKQSGTIRLYPGVEIYTKDEGLEQVWLYFDEPVEVAPTVESITVKGFANKPSTIDTRKMAQRIQAQQMSS
ncbi:hypothetical protein DYGSA30_14680 [Dyella sp. GSA-30]|nr:hypothetical protein DYGSA30_14680 [Dyella sp. GSA-30]